MVSKPGSRRQDELLKRGERPPTHRLASTGNDGGNRRVRTAYARPYEVMGGGYFTTEARARHQAKELADRDGRPYQIYDRGAGVWLSPASPTTYRCQNSLCAHELTAAQFSAHYASFRCPHCPAKGGRR